MDTKIKVIMMVIFSGIVSLTWILGLIFANIDYFLLAMVILLISLIPAFKYFDEINEYFKKRGDKVVEDERIEYMQGKAGNISFGIFIAFMLYCGIAMLTLRNVYPEYTLSSYIILLLSVIGLIIYITILQYYKRKHI